VTRQAEQPRPRVARLRARRHRADLDEAEAERAERIQVFGVLVQSGGEPHRVGETDAEGIHRQVRNGRREAGGKPAAPGRVQSAQGQAMGGFGIQGEKQRAQELIEAQGRLSLRHEARHETGAASG